MKRATTGRAILYSLFLLFGTGATAQANMGVPMLFITLPTMICALVPIVLVEAAVLSRNLHVPFAKVFKPVALANVYSTLLGVPLAWLALFVLEAITDTIAAYFLRDAGSGYGIKTLRGQFLSITWGAPWLSPYAWQIHWMIPAATLTLLVPFFFASWLTERRVAAGLLAGVSSAQVNRGMFFANLASYVLLALWEVGLLLKAIQ